MKTDGKGFFYFWDSSEEKCIITHLQEMQIFLPLCSSAYACMTTIYLILELKIINS